MSSNGSSVLVIPREKVFSSEIVEILNQVSNYAVQNDLEEDGKKLIHQLFYSLDKHKTAVRILALEACLAASLSDLIEQLINLDSEGVEG